MACRSRERWFTVLQSNDPMVSNWSKVGINPKSICIERVSSEGRLIMQRSTIPRGEGETPAIFPWILKSVFFGFFLRFWVDFKGFSPPSLKIPICLPFWNKSSGRLWFQFTKLGLLYILPNIYWTGPYICAPVSWFPKTGWATKPYYREKMHKWKIGLWENNGIRTNPRQSNKTLYLKGWRNHCRLC